MASKEFNRHLSSSLPLMLFECLEQVSRIKFKSTRAREPRDVSQTVDEWKSMSGRYLCTLWPVHFHSAVLFKLRCVTLWVSVYMCLECCLSSWRARDDETAIGSCFDIFLQSGLNGLLREELKSAHRYSFICFHAEAGARLTFFFAILRRQRMNHKHSWSRRVLMHRSDDDDCGKVRDI